MRKNEDQRWRTQRSIICKLVRTDGATDDDPRLIAARAELHTIAAELQLRDLVAKAPTITNEQRNRLIAILSEGGQR